GLMSLSAKIKSVSLAEEGILPGFQFFLEFQPLLAELSLPSQVSVSAEASPPDKTRTTHTKCLTKPCAHFFILPSLLPSNDGNHTNPLTIFSTFWTVSVPRKQSRYYSARATQCLVRARPPIDGSR